MRIKKKAKTEKRAVVEAEGKREATATVKISPRRKEGGYWYRQNPFKAISKAGPRADAGAVVKAASKNKTGTETKERLPDVRPKLKMRPLEQLGFVLRLRLLRGQAYM